MIERRRRRFEDRGRSVGGWLSRIALGAVVISAVSATAAAAAECPNEAVRAEQGVVSAGLPACMALELVSPAKKDGKTAVRPAISADGTRVAFKSGAAFGDTPALLGESGDYYVAERDESGWGLIPTSPDGVVNGWGDGVEAQSFLPSFSSWFQLASRTATEVELGEAQVFRGFLTGEFLPVSPLLLPQNPETVTFSTIVAASLKGASEDHSHVYFSPGVEHTNGTVYLPGDPVPRPSATTAGSVYLAKLESDGTPTLRLLTRDSANKVWSSGCGAYLGGPSNRNQGAVSVDGGLTYFSSRPDQAIGEACEGKGLEEKLRILKRQENGGIVTIAPLIAAPNGDCDRVTPEPACSTSDGDDLYQGASGDNKRLYFTTNRQLANSDLDGTGFFSGCTGVILGGCDLYLYDTSLPEGERLIQVSAGEAVPGHEVGKEAKVLNGTVGISGDGSHVYFAAEGILTNDTNAEDELPKANEPNLYLYRRDGAHPEGELAFLGTLDAADKGSLYGGSGTFRNRAYPVPALGSGHILVFQTKAKLGAEDADGTGLDVYRYDTNVDQISCVSCAPDSTPSTPDSAPFDVVGRTGGSSGTDYAEAGRWVSEGGDTVVFQSPQALLPGDDGEELVDSYLWRDGQLARLPGTTDDGNLSDLPVLSHDGSQVAFQSFEPLLPVDGDTTLDIYLAREGGGFRFPDSEPKCKVGDTVAEQRCRAKPVAPPLAPLAPSQSQQGEGNPPPHRPCARSARSARRLSTRAKHLRRNAGRVRAVRRARRLSRKAARLAKAARRQSRQAKRCRNANRRAEK